MLTAAITGDNEIEVEEAFFRTTALRDGFTIKGGRFFSGFGYLNEVHAHAWDFVDQPLVYQAMFGGQYRQNGVQVKWLAPTDLFLEFGAETGNGDGFPATRLESNGFNGATLFAHVGGDIGDYTSWRAGASWLTQQAEDRAGGIEDANPARRCSIRSPATRDTWVRRRRAQVGAVAAPPAQGAGRVHASRRERRDRFDAAGVAAGRRLSQHAVRLVPAERLPVRAALARGCALRLARLRNAATTALRARPDLLERCSPDRVSLMLDWNPSEFSRLRAQYDWDDARDDGETRSHPAPAIHLRHRRARRAQVLGIHHEEFNPY